MSAPADNNLMQLLTNPAQTFTGSAGLNGMQKIQLAAIVLVASLAASANAAAGGLLSKSGPVIAYLAGDLYLGEAVGNLDGSGTVRIQSQATPSHACQGQFTSSAERGGVGRLECTDGVTATFQFKRLSITRGHGSGVSSRGPLSFTYGLSPDEARRYLRASAI